MGVYWQFVNRTKREVVKPHDCGGGAKWNEVVWPGSPAMIRVASLFQSGQWLPTDDFELINDSDGEEEYCDTDAASQLNNEWALTGYSAEEWAATRAKAVAKIGEWQNVSRPADGVTEEWDDEKADALRVIAYDQGWYVDAGDGVPADEVSSDLVHGRIRLGGVLHRQNVAFIEQFSHGFVLPLDAAVAGQPLEFGFELPDRQAQVLVSSLRICDLDFWLSDATRSITGSSREDIHTLGMLFADGERESFELAPAAEKMTVSPLQVALDPSLALITDETNLMQMLADMLLQAGLTMESSDAEMMQVTVEIDSNATRLRQMREEKPVGPFVLVD